MGKKKSPGLISICHCKWGVTEMECFSELFKFFMSWGQAVSGCDSSNDFLLLPPLGGQVKSADSWEQCPGEGERGQHETLTAPNLHGYMIRAEMEGVRAWGEAATAAQRRRGGCGGRQEIRERLFWLPLSPICTHREEDVSL